MIRIPGHILPSETEALSSLVKAWCHGRNFFTVIVAGGRQCAWCDWCYSLFLQDIRLLPSSCFVPPVFIMIFFSIIDADWVCNKGGGGGENKEKKRHGGKEEGKEKTEEGAKTSVAWISLQYDDL